MGVKFFGCENRMFYELFSYLLKLMVFCVVLVVKLGVMLLSWMVMVLYFLRWCF